MPNLSDTALFTKAGFTIEQIGGSATAWSKRVGKAYVWVTGQDGGSHQTATGETMLIGLYDAHTGTSLLADDCAYANTAAEAIAAAEALFIAVPYIENTSRYPVSRANR